MLELAYALHPGVWGRGYATEAARGVLAWAAVGHGDREFQASTDAPNEGSLRVLARLGFREVRRTPGSHQETVHLQREGVPGPGARRATRRATRQAETLHLAWKTPPLACLHVCTPGAVLPDEQHRIHSSGTRQA